MLKKFSLVLLAAVLLHVILGWAWTMLAGVLAGMWVDRRGWLVGGSVVALDWLLLIGWNFVVAGHAVSRMLSTVGGIIGNMPGLAVVGVTLLIGAVVGTLGGVIGSGIAALTRGKKAEALA